MSRRDIITLLERLSLDHRASLAEKACSYLLSVESNRTLKSHPSHAAICVDIAAEQLNIEVSRQALVRMSGAPSPVAYNSILQTLRRQLLGDRGGSGLGSTFSSSPSSSSSSSPSLSTPAKGMVSAHQVIVDLITPGNVAMLKQMCIQRGSMELDGLVLECLSCFFDQWAAALTPAQRAHVDYADLKWVGAAFWLCSLARQRQIKVPTTMPTAASAPSSPSPSSSSTTTTTTGDTRAAAKTAPKRLGGKGAKELKEMILEVLQHRVTAKELDKTIRLMEDTVREYLLSLGVVRKATAAATAVRRGGGVGKPGRKPNGSDHDTGDSAPTSAASSDTEMSTGATFAERTATGEVTVTATTTTTITTTSASGVRRARNVSSSSVAGGPRAAAKRTISNISDLSMDGKGMMAIPQSTGEGVEVPEPTNSSSSRCSSNTVEMGSAQPPAAKRAKLEGGGVSKTQGSATWSTRDPATASSTFQVRRRTGNVYTMVPRVPYQQTKAYRHYVEWRKHILEKLSS